MLAFLMYIACLYDLHVSSYQITSNISMASTDEDSVGNVFASQDDNERSNGESPDAPPEKRRRTLD